MGMIVETKRYGDHDYMGQVTVYDDDRKQRLRRLYTIKSNIRRLTREDAFSDADRMYETAKKTGILE